MVTLQQNLKAQFPTGRLRFKGDVTYAFTNRTFNLNAFRECWPHLSRHSTRYGDYYISTGATLSVNHQFPSNFVGKVNIGYTNNDYAQYGIYTPRNGQRKVKQNVNNPNFGLGLDYIIRKGTSLGVHYRYNNYDSNIDVEKYKENRLGFLLSIAL